MLPKPWAWAVWGGYVVILASYFVVDRDARFWVLIPALLFNTVVLLAVRERRSDPERRASAGLCPDCGYDLRGTPDGCPECGRALPLGPQPLASAAEGGRVEVVVPPLGAGVETAVLNAWHRADGEMVPAGVALCKVETTKATVDLVSPARGTLRRAARAGATVRVGERIGTIEGN
ncbi:MAG: biotin/lipoyl-containing protein [Phycisphaerae bacterium]|nr:biotin/lipoyl-containing protein [Tepidisphaeraceae bacterium]